MFRTCGNLVSLSKSHLCCLLTAKEELLCVCRRDFPKTQHLGIPHIRHCHFAYTSSSWGHPKSSQLARYPYSLVLGKGSCLFLVLCVFFLFYVYLYFICIFIKYSKEGDVFCNQFSTSYSLVPQIVQCWLPRSHFFPHGGLILYKGQNLDVRLEA